MNLVALTPAAAEAKRDQLVDLLVDAVEGGASVNFVWPMTREKAERWWDGALRSHASGERAILAIEEGERLLGSVQLILAPQENQNYRADVGKLLVLRQARRRGLGQALMGAVEAEARVRRRTLLTLDTETGSDAERLYLRLGWTRFGQVPGYARTADGSARALCSFFFKEIG